MDKVKLNEKIDSILKELDSQKLKDIVASTKAAGKESGTFEVVITTEDVDRYGEIIKLDGWELDHFRSNPVVLWGHSHYDLPIGIATEVTRTDKGLVAKGFFAPEEANPEAQKIRKLYDAGVVKATSVGFIEKEREGNIITKAELIEFSFVSVPANPFALSTIQKAGLSVSDLVTKGILETKSFETTIKDMLEGTTTLSTEEEEDVDTEEEVVASEAPTEDVVEDTEEETVDDTVDEKSIKISKATYKKLVGILKDIEAGALEGEESPERTDDIDEVATDEAQVEGEGESQDPNKSFIDSAKQARKILQVADSSLGEILAEFRSKYHKK